MSRRLAPIALLLAVLPGQERAGRRGVDRAELARRIDALVEPAWRALDLPGAALLVAQGAEVLHEKGYGFADLENRVPVTPQTVFRIGSVTKQFTAAAILKLGEAGRLGLQSRLAGLAPKFAFPGHAVTVQQLLNHSSGIKSFTRLPGFGRDRSRDIGRAELFAMIRDQPFDFEPGTRVLYNNSGYYLLGVVVEELAGKPYDRYLTEQFFRPLGMTQTRYGGAAPIVPHRARGYELRDGQLRNARPISMGPPFAAGALLSSVRDLHRWTVALHGGQVLSAASYRAMITPVGVARRPQGGVGYGLMVRRLGDAVEIGHGGAIVGFGAYLAYYPASRLTVVLLINRSPSRPEPLARRVAEVALAALQGR